ncbi:hypothetical protein ACFY5C_22465 [Streptomyces sp. NPDC012935]|uniref:hypothetical protein n=1 Tax=Streptomyces sp. NPDC012935 TaxID=3364857 RepID=UPI003695BAC7
MIRGSVPLVDTVRAEVAEACRRFGGSVRRDSAAAPGPGPCDLVLELAGTEGGEGFTSGRGDSRTTVTASGASGLLYGLFHVVRLGEAAFHGDRQPAGTPAGHCSGRTAGRAVSHGRVPAGREGTQAGHPNG